MDTEKTEIKWLKMFNDLLNSGKCALDAINEVVRQGQLERKDSAGSWVNADNLIKWCEEQKDNIHTAAEELGYNDEIIQQHYSQFIKCIQLESQPKQKEI